MVGYILNPEKFQKDRYNFYKEISQKNESFFELLKLITPLAYNYEKRGGIITDEIPSNFRNIELLSRACDARYFNLYYSLNQNNLNSLSAKVIQVIRNIASSTDNECFHIAKNNFEQLLKHKPFNEEVKILELLEVGLKEKEYKKPFIIANAFMEFENFNEWELRKYCSNIFARLLSQSDEKDFSKMLYKLSKSYDKLSFLDLVANWFNDYELGSERTDSQKLVLKAYKDYLENRSDAMGVVRTKPVQFDL